MGVEQVYQFLKKKKGWWTARQVVDNSNMELHAVSRGLMKLRLHWPETIKFKDKYPDNKNNTMMYKAI